MIFSKIVYLKSLFKKNEIKDIIFSIINPLNKIYYGTIFEDGKKYDFSICRNINYGKNIYYKNSFQPIIKGKIYSYNDYSIIKLKISTILFIKIFLIIWLGGTIIIGLSLSLYYYFEKIIFFVIPIIMLIVYMILRKFGFINEYIKTKEYLIHILKAEEIKKINCAHFT